MLEKLFIRPANSADLDHIWEIIRQAINKRKEEGSDQWQDGYPNISVLKEDIKNHFGYVVFDKEYMLGYVAVIDREESAYKDLKGQWLSEQKYIAVHRLATSQDKKIKGLGTWIMQKVENIAQAKNIYSIKIDTNFDNTGMLKILEKLGYQYCGEVFYDGDPRKAFEKILK